MNIVLAIVEVAIRHLDALAVVWVGAGGERALTFGQLVRQMTGFSDFFATTKLNAGDCVILQIKNPVLDLVSFLALSSMGVGVFAVRVPSGGDRSVSSRLGIAIGVVTRNSREVITDEAICLDATTLTEVPAMVASLSRVELRNRDNQPWLVRSTSGTTGVPKAFLG